MKSNKEIEKLSEIKYPVYTIISALGGTEDSNRDSRWGYQNGYKDCQKSSQSVNCKKREMG